VAKNTKKPNRKPRVSAAKQKVVKRQIFANKVSEHMVFRLRMMEQGFKANSIGYMESKDVRTGEIVELLVGVEEDEDGIHTFPLARMLTRAEDLKYYLPPDGEGGYGENLVAKQLDGGYESAEDIELEAEMEAEEAAEFALTPEVVDTLEAYVRANQG
jgi:hypothetical protein